jgi:hypothetical protein
MTTEERLSQVIGNQAIAICSLQTQLEQAQKQIAELQKPTDKSDTHLRAVPDE